MSSETETRNRLARIIGAVLFNVNNFPPAAQTRLLGQNMAPLNRNLTDAILAAGYVHESEAQVREQVAVEKALPDAPNNLIEELNARISFNSAGRQANDPWWRGHVQGMKDTLDAILAAGYVPEAVVVARERAAAEQAWYKGYVSGGNRAKRAEYEADQ